MNILLILFLTLVVLSDLRTYKIKNWMLLLGLALGVLYRIQVGDYLNGILALLIPFFLLYPFFVFGALGAADIKLICILGLWMTPVKVLYFTFLAFLISALIALIKGLALGIFKERIHYLAGYVKSCYMCRSILPFQYNQAKEEAKMGTAIHMAFPIAVSMLAMRVLQVV